MNRSDVERVVNDMLTGADNGELLRLSHLKPDFNNILFLMLYIFIQGFSPSKTLYLIHKNNNRSFNPCLVDLAREYRPYKYLTSW